jgi:hypothetical protein
MVNPFDPTYLITPAVFGPLEWAFFLLQIAGVAGGFYLIYGRQDSNRVRKMLLTRLGYALIVAGGIGVLLGVLRLNQVAGFGQPFWFLLLLLAELGLAGYVVYYARSVYPAQLAQSRTRRGKTSGRQGNARISAAQPKATNGSSPSPDKESVAARSGRREARHRRKRKQRH